MTPSKTAHKKTILRAKAVRKNQIVTLLTDFGTIDGYVGAMIGSILHYAPNILPISISHEVPSFDVEHAAYIGKTAWSYFPKGTIHIAVVDPGVGTLRRPLAINKQGNIYIGPDNGIFTSVLRGKRSVRVIDFKRLGFSEPSATFHGRDVFAPVAGLLAAGKISFHSLGVVLSDPILLPVWRVEITKDKIECYVIHVDRFGNAILGIEDKVANEFRKNHGLVAVLPSGEIIQRSRSYGDVSSGKALLLTGSSGHLEIAICEGSAAATLGLLRGTKIILRRVKGNC